MLKLNITHRERSPKLQSLPVGITVPSQIRRTTLCLGANLGASLIPVCDLGCALNPSISGLSLAAE